MLNNCNGHGSCINTTSTCICYDGWGSPNDATFYRTPDCSLRVCPSDRAWADVPLSSSVAHQPMECANRGVCDRSSGLCSCFPGFTGSACQRSKCPNDCSGHGVCLSMRQLARMDAALPLAPNTYYEGEVVSNSIYFLLLNVLTFEDALFLGLSHLGWRSNLWLSLWFLLVSWVRCRTTTRTGMVWSRLFLTPLSLRW